MSEEATATASNGKPKGKKLAIVGLALVLIAGGGAGGAWWFLKGQKAEAASGESASKAAAKALFTTLEPFTVNLQEPRGDRFAQIGITLQFEDPLVEGLVKERLPALRNDILLLISSKQTEELLTTDGKRKLAEEIQLRAGRALGYDLPDPDPSARQVVARHDEDHDEAEAPKVKRKGKKAQAAVNPITAILFNQFIVQ